MDSRERAETPTSIDTTDSLFVPAGREYSARFEKFWRDEYPRHEAKSTAWRAWKRLGLEADDLLLRRIVKDVRLRRQGAPWRENGGAFIPQLTSYLNGRRWEDEPSPHGQMRSKAPTGCSTYGARDALLGAEPQPVSYTAYRKRLENTLQDTRVDEANAEDSAREGPRLALT